MWANAQRDGHPAKYRWSLCATPQSLARTHFAHFSVNLECRSETYCAWLGQNAGRKKLPKNRRLGTIAQLCQAISSQLRHVSTIGKKVVKQQYLLHMSPQTQYGEL